MILQEMKDAARKLCGDKTVTKLTCGVFFTAVTLSDGSGGISFAFPYGDSCQVDSASYRGSTVGRSAAELVELLGSRNLVDAAIAVATVNALTAAPRRSLPDTASSSELQIIRPTDTVGIVGNFGPLCAKIGSLCKEVRVFDIKPVGNMYPVWSESIYLPGCDVVYITASTLINNTLDGVLSFCTDAREIVLLGPTVVEMPELFRAHGVTLLAGAELIDTEKAHRMILEGASGHDIVSKAEGITRAYTHRL